MLSLHCNPSRRVSSLSVLFYASVLQLGDQCSLPEKQQREQQQEQQREQVAVGGGNGNGNQHLLVGLESMAKPVRSAVLYNLFRCCTSNCQFAELEVTYGARRSRVVLRSACNPGHTGCLWW